MPITVNNRMKEKIQFTSIDVAELSLKIRFSHRDNAVPLFALSPLLSKGLLLGILVLQHYPHLIEEKVPERKGWRYQTR